LRSFLRRAEVAPGWRQDRRSYGTNCRPGGTYAVAKPDGIPEHGRRPTKSSLAPQLRSLIGLDVGGTPIACIEGTGAG